MSRKKDQTEERFPHITAAFNDHLRAVGIIPAREPAPAFPCTCGKGLRSAEALKTHMLAMGCRNSRQRKRAERQRRKRREALRV